MAAIIKIEAGQTITEYQNLLLNIAGGLEYENLTLNELDLIQRNDIDYYNDIMKKRKKIFGEDKED